MWPFRSDRSALEEGHEDAGETQRTMLSRFRRNARFYDRYWSRFFQVTRPDMGRLVAFIQSRGAACHLTALAREVIRSRISEGPQLTGEASVRVRQDTPGVRYWDPTAAWSVGDRTLVAVDTGAERLPFVPRVGRIAAVDGGTVTVAVDGLPEPQRYGARPGAEEGRVPEALVRALMHREDENSQIDYVLWRYGDRVVEQLLAALFADDRFVCLSNLWYLRALAGSFDEDEVAALARALFNHGDAPVSTEGLLALFDPPLPADDATRFGLLLALRDHPERFSNAGTFDVPAWTLAGPPPGRWIARHAAYDPDTFEILCMPWEPLDRDAARRLWACGLFRAVVTGAGDPDETPFPD